MQLDFKARELTVKLVYYGPALSGKTTNLEAIHRLVAPGAAGRLMTLETRDDRTLFFDLLPLYFASTSGLSVRLKLFTVPGQVLHDATRRLVLQGADGTAFIADSRRSEARANRAAFLNMQENLADNGIDPNAHPLVLQFNKRDLPDVQSDDELERLAALGREPVFKAIAKRGVGVLETFLGLFELTLAHLDAEHGLREKFDLDPTRLLTEAKARLLREVPS